MKPSIKISDGDKATPRPWNYSQGEIYVKDGGKYHLVASTNSDSFHEKRRNANAALIVKAVNEFEVLEEISKAAKAACESMAAAQVICGRVTEGKESWQSYAGKTAKRIESSRLDLMEALTNLEAVRKEGK